jgi:uncharacterized protein (TIGR02266 family)
MKPSPTQLRQAEEEAAALEEQQGGELAQLLGSLEELGRRLETARASMEGLSDPKASAFAEKLKKVAFKPPELNGELERMIEARTKALEGRAKAREAIAKAIEKSRSDIGKWTQQMTTAEEMAQQIVERHRSAAAAPPPPAPSPVQPQVMHAAPEAPVEPIALVSPPHQISDTPTPVLLQPAQPAALKEKKRPQAPPPAEAKPERHHRVKMQAQVDLGSESNFFTGFSTNISDGGLFIATVNMVPLGTEIDVKFSLPSGEKIEVKGKVRWLREINDRSPDIFPGLGVQFVDLTPEAQKSIHRFVASREPMFFPD